MLCSGGRGSWMSPIIRLGQKKVLREIDLPELSQQDSSEYLAGLFHHQWQEEKDRKGGRPPRLWLALLRTFGPMSLLIFPCLFLSTAAKIVQAAVGIQHLVRLLDEGAAEADMKQVYLYASVIVVCGLVMLTVHHTVQFIGWRLGLAMRTTMMAAVYRKALALPQCMLADVSSGYIMSLCSSDVERFQLFCVYSHYLVLAPFEVGAILYCGMRLTIGLPFLMGMIVLFIIIPVQAVLAKSLNRLGKKANPLTDSRVKLSKQAIEGARIIKMSGWELALFERIGNARAREIALILEGAIVRSISEGVFFLCPSVAGAATFITASLMGMDLSPGIVFSTLTLFNILQWDLVNFASKAMQTLSEVLISIQRLEAFLLLPEEVVGIGPPPPPPSPVLEASTPSIPASHLAVGGGPINAPPPPPPPRGSILATSLSSSWTTPTTTTTTTTDFTIHGINLDVHPGQLIAIIGQVASGKTSLLLTLLRELHISNQSTLVVNGTVAFAPQEPWIMTGSVRENILMGRPWYPKRYRDVLRGCCLLKDLRTMPHGDLTVIGDRGINLSGGQKARLGLARVVYGEADVYLIDDAFSALDPRVGRKVFRRIITGLLSTKTRVIATHQIQHLHVAASTKAGDGGGGGGGVSRVMVLKDGTIRGEAESMSELREKFREYFSSSGGIGDGGGGGGGGDGGGGSSGDGGGDGRQGDASERGKGGGEVWWEGDEGGGDDDVDDDDEDDDDEDEDAEGVSLTGFTKEVSIREGIVVTEAQVDGRCAHIGHVTGNTYVQYMASFGGYHWTLFLASLFITSQLAHIATTVFLSFWSDLPLDRQRQPHRLAGYLLLVVAVAVFAILRAHCTYRSLILGSQRLHDTMMMRLLRAPSSFFDANPTGRILNRATKDVYISDTLLPYAIYDFVQCACNCLGVIGVVTAVNPWLLFMLPPLFYLFLRLRTAFLHTSREARRIESVARSPIFSLLSETLDGLTTIRTLGGASERMEGMFHERLDGYARPYFIFVGAGRHLGFRLDCLCWLVVVATTYTSLEAEDVGTGAKAQFFGMSIMYVLQLAAIFQWTIRQSSEVENYIVAVERILEEAALETDPGHKPPSSWPQHGGIEVQGIAASYRVGLQPVLHDLSFHVKPGDKVGLVGRTGAGKSSTVQVLFRLIEPSGGDIVIDGVSITTLGLHDLRTKLSVIPQVPFLFSGTVRENMDPIGQHADAELWSALHDVHMKDAVVRLGGLQGSVAESGGNLSTGERQLMCLARAILERNTILILDEATANIDMRTDALIQATIREKFLKATVIAVAHRLQTIIDCDQVVVLSNGSLAECGHPYELLKRGQGAFCDMVKETGEETEMMLRERAQEAWLKRRSG